MILADSTTVLYDSTHCTPPLLIQPQASNAFHRLSFQTHAVSQLVSPQWPVTTAFPDLSSIISCKYYNIEHYLLLRAVVTAILLLQLLLNTCCYCCMHVAVAGAACCCQDSDYEWSSFGSIINYKPYHDHSQVAKLKRGDYATPPFLHPPTPRHYVGKGNLGIYAQMGVHPNLQEI